MPIYDVVCRQCREPFSFIANYEQYDAACASAERGEDTPEFTCKCGQLNTREDREICRNIKKRVIGVRKGNFNSNDYS